MADIGDGRHLECGQLLYGPPGCEWRALASGFEDHGYQFDRLHLYLQAWYSLHPEERG